MGIFSRLSKVLESNLNALVERAEDPTKMLDQAIEDMRAGHKEARVAIIEAKTQKRLIEKRRDKALGEAQDYERKAMGALQKGDEPLARRIIELKLASEQRAEAETAAADEQDKQIHQLEKAEKELERRLAEMPARRATLLARQSTAQAKGARVGATNKVQNSVSSALQAFDRMEEKVIRAEVEAEVMGDGEPADLDTRSLDALRTDDALLALKAKMMAQLPARAGTPPPEPDPEPDIPSDAVDDSLAALKAKLGPS